ncbi:MULTISPECIES: sigma-70 family RNA polymerase sigma factor [unclassified Leifsonia]|uniref:sigma-70 family RNA polymerase sigma factor n=1 Tax=unclassified Leifsonia TaxID=2663824 RepID=UPI0008A76AF4|nr:MULTISPECIES: sigma-70 family RNA polymerase sigma factor [unclassified Leifsonia]SEH59306.1 RNA polymerase sigma factor, sigma-70 family [Leifsonia sp. CL154]SFL19765.1 RNA polymerase sigma factor, sigma-70 family [Leifsonia sp. CL147]
MTRELDALSDTELIVRARKGDSHAYGVLWKRHWPAARGMAASITGRFEPDDLASEAFARILKAVEKGSGPRSGFRSYLATTIRNVAIDWSRRKTTPNIEDPDSVEDWTYSEVTALNRIDRQTIARAFYALPDSWQEVLWYTEVEDMAPRDVAPLLGLTPNAVSALAFRAREGLRQAWITAHLAESNSTDPAHAWTLNKLGSYVRDKLSPAERRKVKQHLAACPACSDAAAEADDVGYRLALGILPLFLGIAGAAAYSAWTMTSDPGGAAVAATLPDPAAGIRHVARLRHFLSAGTGGSNIGMVATATTMVVAAALTAGAVMAPPESPVAASASAGVTPSSGPEHTSGAGRNEAELPSQPGPLPAPGILPTVPLPTDAGSAVAPPAASVPASASSSAGGPAAEPTVAEPAPTEPTVTEPAPTEPTIAEPSPTEPAGPGTGQNEDGTTGGPGREAAPGGCEAALRSVPSADTLLAYALDDPEGSMVATDLAHGGTAQYDGFPGEAGWSLTDSTRRPATDVFSIQIWFTTTVGGGRLLGFSSSPGGPSLYHDRQLFLTDDGRLVFGVFPEAVHTVESSRSYSDGRWHQATATLSNDGMALYVDGELVARDSTVTHGEDFGGFWRIGYDSLANWGPGTPSRYQFTGSLAYAAVYGTALSADQIRSQWSLCGG